MPPRESGSISVEERRGGSNCQTRRGWWVAHGRTVPTTAGVRCASSDATVQPIALPSRRREHEMEQLPGPLRARVGVGVLEGKEGS